MIHYIITTECSKNCSNCFVKNINISCTECIKTIYWKFCDQKALGHSEITLYIGELKSFKKFEHVYNFAKTFFKGGIHIVTDDLEKLKLNWKFKSIRLCKGMEKESLKGIIILPNLTIVKEI